MWTAKLLWLLGRMPLLSRTLRWLAQRYEDGSVVSIRSGLARGMRWKRYHRYVNGYWTGQYELPVQIALRRELGTGNVLYDLGANAGFFSLVGCSLVGSGGTVVSFDPDPANSASMADQKALNHLDNWHIVQRAVAATSGTATFSLYSPGVSGHLGDARGEEKSMQVEVTTLDDALSEFPPPDVVKIDIEGAEVQALQGASRMLSEVRPVFIVELHSPDCRAGVQRILHEKGYQFYTLLGEPVLGPNLPRQCVARHGSDPA